MPALSSTEEPPVDHHHTPTAQFTCGTPPRFPSSLSLRSPNNSRPNSPPDTAPNTPLVYPTQSAPPFASTLSTLRRSLSSKFSLIPEDRAVHITSVNRDGFIYQFRRETPDPTATPIHNNAGPPPHRCPLPPPLHLILRLLLWWPLLVFHTLRGLISFLFTAPIDRIAQHATAAPANSTCIRSLLRTVATRLLLLWLTIPLNIVKYTISVLSTPASERARPKRTVLISGGSTIQSLHLARNFHSAGFRVIAADFEGSFALAGFSSSVSKYYTLPRPPSPSTAGLGGGASAYIGRLCDIVETEKPVLYIPVCASSVAQFDALAKPHLVLRGCTTFCPGVQECAVLDDLAELLFQCGRLGIAVPDSRTVRSVPELLGLYDSGWVAQVLGDGGRLRMHPRGGLCVRADGTASGWRYRRLPADRDRVAAAVGVFEISDLHPWLVVAEQTGGDELHTCTTVRESRVVANVTCRRSGTGAMRPDADANKEVERWLAEFFARVRLQRPIDGHISFRLRRGGVGGSVLVPVGVRVGVPPAYICHTGVQTRVLMPPCRHFSRHKSGPLVLAGERYWVHDALLAALRHPSVGAVRRLLVGGMLDGGEALFVYWDPLPGMVYSVWQLPWTVARAWRRRRVHTVW